MYILYALLTAIATFIGGFLPFLPFFKKLDFTYLIGFSAGAMLSIAFFDIFPQISSENTIAFALGFFSIYVIEKFIIVHSCKEGKCDVHVVGWAALIGVAAESLADGIAIAIGYIISPILGLVIALSVMIHELPRGLTTTIIMKVSKYSFNKILFALAIDGGFTIIGALLAGVVPSHFFKHILAFAAGTFLYIGATDLLPEVHKKFNIAAIISVILGALAIALLSMLIKI
ncbi:MAG: ZIP family metal transporter [Nanoarchaeota archaeon]